MTNFIELHMKNSVTSLELVDTELRLFKTSSSKLLPLRSCDVCGVPESIVKLYDGVCKDCAKHYIFD